MSPRPRIALATLLVLLLAGAAAAQFGRGFFRTPPRQPNAESFGKGFNFCRGVYTSGRREPGGQGWSTDYPDAERNFSIRLAELTRTRISRVAGTGEDYGEPDYLTIRLQDPALLQCPYLHMEDVGTAAFTDLEIEGLRTYLLKGGFLWVDDFWGSFAWENWERQIGRVLPPTDFPIRDVPLDHPIYRTHFEVKELPQIPSIQFWRTSGGGTSERGIDSAEPRMRAIFDERGTIMVLMTHNTDISDAWEREGEDPRFFYNFSPDGYAVGINVIIYALTH
ncbi:MAG: DUF4159 domain-containing protein [Vicinamibacterales bacterium]